MPTIKDVKEQTPWVQYNGGAGQDTYIYPYVIFDERDVIVDIDGVILALNTDYTVTGVTDEDGGNIILTTPTSGGELVTIYRQTPIDRLTDYVENGDFLAETVNNDFDRIILMLQEIRGGAGGFNRALKFSKTDPIQEAKTIIADVNTRKNLLLGFDDLGDPTYYQTGVIADAKVYNTVNDLKADSTLELNDSARTLGYYQVGDGGAASYYISSLPFDGYGSHEISNGLTATLIVDNTVNVNQFGAASFINDSAPSFNAALNSPANVIKASSDYIVRTPINMVEGKILNLQGSNILGDNGLQGDYSHQGLIVCDLLDDFTIANGNISMYGENWDLGPGGEVGKVSMILVKNCNGGTIYKTNGDGGCNRSGTGFFVVGSMVHFSSSNDVDVLDCRYNGYFRTGSVHDAEVLGFKPYTEAYYIDGTSESITVAFCHSNNCSYSGITVQAGDMELKHHVIAQNKVNGTDGTCLSLNTSGVSVVGNILRNSYSNGGITISHTGQNANHNTIVGNIIDGVWFNGIAYGDASYNNNCNSNIIIRPNQSGTDPSSEAGHAIRVRGLRNICNCNIIEVSNSGDVAISCHSTNDLEKFNYVNNVINSNIVNAGFISVRAPYTLVQGNQGNSGTMNAFIVIGFRSSYTSVQDNNCYNITRCVSVSANTADPSDYVGISVFNNHGGTADNPEVVNVPVNKQATLAPNFRYEYTSVTVGDRDVAWELKGETKDGSITGVNKATGSIKALSQNSSGTQYGFVIEGAAVTGGELTVVEAFEVSPFACEIRRLKNGQSKLIMTNEVGVRYALTVTGGALTVTPE